MKCLTLNVHAWLEDNQEEKITILAETVVAEGYDVVALQEVNQSLTSPLVLQDLKADNFGLILLDKINQVSQDKYAYFWTYSHIGYDTYEEGLAILTKHPVLALEQFYCSQHQTVDSILARKIIGVTLDYQGQEVTCYSCHINLPDCKKENQLANIQAILQHSDHEGLKVLLGDFNTDALSNPAAYQTILELGLLDTYQLAKVKDEGITVAKAIDGWQEHQTQKRLDYIFLNQKREVLKSQVIFNGHNRAVISDHFGLEVEIIV